MEKERDHFNLAEKLIQIANEEGLPVIEKTIPFLNDDVPKYLAKLKLFEEDSKKVDIKICYHALTYSPTY